MRIGIDIRALMEGKTTGVEVYVTNLLHHLFRFDKVNEYCLFINSYRDVSRSLPKFDYPNVKLYSFRYPNKFFNLLQIIFKYPKIDRLLDGLELFFSPNWRATALSSKVPLIVTFHDLSFEIVPEFYTLWKRIWHRLMGYRQVAKRADKIIAVSESTKKDLVELYGINPDKIAVIHSGVKGAEWEQGEKGREEVWPRDYFLSLCTFEPRKNIEAVIEAYRLYRKLPGRKRALVLAGSSGWKVKLEIPKEIRSSVFVVPNPGEGQKADLYKNTFAMLFLSFYEGFGFPILEAASYGVPVISSFATSLAEIGHEFALLVNPFRPPQVAAVMQALETDHELYDKLKTMGLKAAKEFSWEKTAQKVLELFSQYENRN